METLQKPVITIGNTYSRLDIPPGLEYYYAPLLSKIDSDLSFFVQGREFMNIYNIIKNGERLWDGKKHLINLTGLPLKKVAWRHYITEPNIFLTGNLFRVVNSIHSFGILPELKLSEENLKLKNQIQSDRIDYEWNDQFQDRDYQIKCVEVAYKKKRGLLQVATGGGKTIIASRLIQKIGLKNVLFLVTTKDLLYQAHDSFNASMNNPGVGIIGDGKCEIGNINVATIQSIIRAVGTDQEYNDSIKKLSDFIEDGFGNDKSEVDQSSIEKIKNLLIDSKVIIFDECQHAPAETCRIVITQCKNALYRYGMSATPFREDGEDLTIEGLFGENLINISSSYLIDNDYLVKPNIIMVDFKKDQERKLQYGEEYKTKIVENELRNRVCASFATTYKKENKTVLVLVKHIKHGKILEKIIPDSFFIDGTKSSKIRNKALEDIRSGELRILIATTLADEGVDIPNLDVLILAGGGKSKTRALQRIGRVVRKSPGKAEAFVVDFLDSGHHSRKHSMARKKIYKTEEKFKDIEVINIDDFLQYSNIGKGKKDLI